MKSVEGAKKYNMSWPQLLTVGLLIQKSPEDELEICSNTVSKGTRPSGGCSIASQEPFTKTSGPSSSPPFPFVLGSTPGKLGGRRSRGPWRGEELPEEKTQVASNKCALGVTGEGLGTLLRRLTTT